MKKEKFITVFMAMSILFMLMPVMAMAEKIPVAILRTNADGKTKTLTFTYAERPKVFAKRGQNDIHSQNTYKGSDSYSNKEMLSLSNRVVLNDGDSYIADSLSKSKADSFISNLSNSSKILLKFPAKAPHNIYYKEGMHIKCYDTLSDTTLTIQYPTSITTSAITNILVGDSSILITTKAEWKYYSPKIFVYQIAQQKSHEIVIGNDSEFFELKSHKISHINKTLSYSYIGFREGDTGIIDITSEIGDYPSQPTWNAFMKKIIYHLVTKVFDFDGNLKSEVARPVTWGQYMKDLQSKRKNNF